MTNPSIPGVDAGLWAMPFRPALPMNRASLRCLGLSVGIAIALTGCASEPPPAVETPEDVQRRGDEVAGAIVRLGYDRWVAACAYDFGLKRLPQEAMKEACFASFDFRASAIEARQRRDREDGLDPKGESAGPQDDAQ